MHANAFDSPPAKFQYDSVSKIVYKNDAFSRSTLNNGPKKCN